MQSTQTSTHLGNFLRSVRLSRGYTNVNEYLRNYKLPITYVYYREIEIGKRKLGLETAKGLYEALDVDAKAFYYHLLKDILPVEVTEHFKYVLPVSQRLSGEELAQEKEHISEAYRDSFLDTLRLNFTMMDDQATDYFKERLDLLPLIWSIYGRTESSEAEITQIAKENGIKTPTQTILKDFKRLGLVKISGKKITRLHPTVTWRDRDLHVKCIVNELEKTTEIGKSDPENNPTFKQGVAMLTDDARKRVLSRLTDLLAELRTSDDESIDGKSELYYFSIILGSRT